MNRSTYLEGVHGTINVSCPCRWACYMDGGVVGEPRKLSPSLVRCQDSIQQKGTKMNGSGLGYWAGEKRRGKKGQQRAQIYEETLISGATTVVPVVGAVFTPLVRPSKFLAVPTDRRLACREVPRGQPELDPEGSRHCAPPLPSATQ